MGGGTATKTGFGLPVTSSHEPMNLCMQTNSLFGKKKSLPVASMDALAGENLLFFQQQNMLIYSMPLDYDL